MAEHHDHSPNIGTELSEMVEHESSDSYRDMDMLRFSTAGSVDDGKSTLIGRLLYDTKSIFQDQLEQIEGASKRRGEEGVNLALLTDGLRAEREQNITIDVAYRYFATPKRKFIIADTPGHVQYTRNMVTGASTAELAIVLVDARKGVLTQSKRHGFIASLLRIPHIVVAINKMDLVNYSQEVFDEVVDSYNEFAEKLDIKDLVYIPMSALKGDNIVTRSAAMPWYPGTTLLHHLETVNVGAHRNMVDFRYPVQYVIRPHQDYRGFAGRVASGNVSVGDEVVVLPNGRQSRIKSIATASGQQSETVSGESVVMELEDEIDTSRGDMIVRKMNLPSVGTRIDAMVCWLGAQPLDPNAQYVLMHTTRQVKAVVDRVIYRVNVDTMHRDEVDTLELNEIGRLEITLAQPIFFDPYQINRETGSFILIDPFSNVTVGAGMIRGDVKSADDLLGHLGDSVRSPDVVWENWNIPVEERAKRNGHEPVVVWLTGLSGSGKSTIARELERMIFNDGCQTMMLDGDQLRHGLNGDLGFTEHDRRENIRRVREVANLFYHQGSIVICAFVSPYRADRDHARALFPEGRFIEVHVDCDIEECRRRDPKGLYKKVDAGDIKGFTGVSAEYEPPLKPELTIKTDELTVEQSAARIHALLKAHGIVR
jgi:bifunctional enzyme CysN/CysC